MSTSPAAQITPAQATQYRDEGYVILPEVLSGPDLALLRGGAQYAVDRVDARLDAAGVERESINLRGKRYFSDHVYLERPELRRFLFGELLAEICRATLGPTAHLFWEQYVVKGGDPGGAQATAFSWHQDSGYVHEHHAPYLTCWIALDDVDEQNGSVYLLPYSRSGIRSYVRHLTDPTTGDRVGYFGSDPGIPVVVPAGSIACFSSVVFHRSGPNRTERPRRAYLAQYSAEIVTTPDGSAPWGPHEPFLAGGANVATI